MEGKDKEFSNYYSSEYFDDSKYETDSNESNLIINDPTNKWNCHTYLSISGREDNNEENDAAESDTHLE